MSHCQREPIVEALAEAFRDLAQDDLIRYGALASIAMEKTLNAARPDLKRWIYDALVSLLREGLVEIGDAKLASGANFVEFHPWEGTLDEIAERLKRLIDATLFPPPLEGGNEFWITRPE